MLSHLSDNQKAAKKRLAEYGVTKVGSIVDTHGVTKVQYKHVFSGKTFTIVASTEEGTATWNSAFDKVRRRAARPLLSHRSTSRPPHARRARPHPSSLSMTAPRSSPPTRRR